VALWVGYDGTDFAGFQTQTNGRSVQGVLEEALGELYGRRVRVRGASRTDSGVHARMQVVAFDLWPGDRTIPVERLALALAGHLPPDVAVVAAHKVPLGFLPRRARSKTYRYRILNRLAPCALRRRVVWHLTHPLDVEAMAQAARLFIGRHDFAALGSAGSPRQSTVREVYSLRVWREGDEVRVEVTANGFLYRMARTLVGSLVEVGRGRWGASYLKEVLDRGDRRQAGPTAPPQGLCLVQVEYDPPLRDWQPPPESRGR
jgi:tRNA pseudouridine38-40 synthase